MPEKTQIPLQCACGRQGTLVKTVGNPGRSDQYELYTPDGMDGRSFCARHSESLEEVFERVKPSCPACGASVSVP